MVNCSAGKRVCSPSAALGAISEVLPPWWELVASFLSTEGCKEYCVPAAAKAQSPACIFTAISSTHSRDKGTGWGKEGNAGALSPAAAQRGAGAAPPAPGTAQARAAPRLYRWPATPAPARGIYLPRPAQPIRSLAFHQEKSSAELFPVLLPLTILSNRQTRRQPHLLP